MASIRAHKGSSTLIISKNSSYAKPIAQNVNLIMGINSRCMGSVTIGGSLELGKNAQVTGNVSAKDVILGPGSIIYGDLTVNGGLMALDMARVTGSVLVTEGAFIRPGVAFGSLEARGLIEMQGKTPSKHIAGKVVVNDEKDEAGVLKKPELAERAPAKSKVPKVEQPPKKENKGKGFPGFLNK